MRDPVDERKRTTLRRFAALGAATPFVGLAGAEPDGSDPGGREGSDVPDAIRGYLSRTPGAHFSKLRDDLQLATGETQHHLRVLLEAGEIVSRRDGEYRRFFPADRFSAFERVALGYLRRETPRRLLMELLETPVDTGSALADRLGVSPATVSSTAGALEEAGLLDRSEGYRIRRAETVLVLLVRYADSFDAETVAFAGRADDLIRVE